MSIPAWTTSGILPPIRPGANGVSEHRSPYKATVTEVIERFGISRERREILNRFLRYRSALHKDGLTKGFQWLDGSFMEEIEVSAGRPPKDIDVVTFFYLPSGVATEDDWIGATDPKWLHNEKSQYKVDAYYLVLGQHMTPNDVRLISYWYSLWSHRRDQVWKGFIEVELDPSNDADAKANLEALASEGGSA